MNPQCHVNGCGYASNTQDDNVADAAERNRMEQVGCSHKDFGCSCVVSFEDLATHESQCRYRTYRCGECDYVMHEHERMNHRSQCSKVAGEGGLDDKIADAANSHMTDSQRNNHSLSENNVSSWGTADIEKNLVALEAAGSAGQEEAMETAALAREMAALKEKISTLKRQREQDMQQH